MCTDLAIHVAAQAEATPASVVIHLFDGPYVTLGRRRINVPEGSKRLLAFVALRHGHVERRYAAGALWPACDDRRAAGNLRSSLWRLRGAGIDVLKSDKWSLRLHDRILVDAQLTLDWANRLITNVPRSDDLVILPERVDALDLLPGFYDDWTIIERERVRQRILHALESLSRFLAQAGRHADAVEAALTAVHAEPLRESAQRALIEAYIGEGNWVEAQRTYITYRNLARRELGVDPSRELTVLVRGELRRHLITPAGIHTARASAVTG
jgi:DNA-binding SARP family transcriptional activator